jgi:DNA polymerase elongation subunit (family B)
MLQFPTDPATCRTDDEILADIYRQARELEAETTALFPAPNAVEFESIKYPFLLTRMKKTYAAWEYPPSEAGWLETPQKLIKGFAIKKRDRCAFVQDIGHQMVDKLLGCVHTDTEIIMWFKDHIYKYFNSRPATETQLEPYVITCARATEYKSETGLALSLAAQIEAETGARPLPGSRMRYVIAHFKGTRKHCEKAVTPEAFLSTHTYLDESYYLRTQTMCPLRQLLDLHTGLYGKLLAFVEQFLVDRQHSRMGVRSVTSMFRKQSSS